MNFRKLTLFLFTFLSVSSYAVVKTPHNDTPLMSLTPTERAWISENSEIVAATSNDWPPFEYIDSKGKERGINIDILNLLAKRTGLKIKTQSGYWSDNLAAFKAKKLDLLIGVKYLKERETFGEYTDSYLQVLDFFFAHESIRNIPFDELVKKRIAIPKGYATQEYIRSNFPDFKIVNVDTLYDAVDAVLEGRADVLFNNYQTVSYILHQEGITDIVAVKSMRYAGKSPIYMLTPYDNEVLNSIINKGLASITPAEKEYLTQLHMGITRKEVFDRLSKLNIVFTPQEKAYLSENPIITLTGDPEWLPYEGLDSAGNYVGIVPDILNIFEARLGIAIQRDIGSTWQESVTLFEQKKVDVISETFNSEVSDGTQYSNVYLSSPIVIVMRDSQQYVSDIQSVSHLRMSLIEDYGYTTQITDAFPDEKFMKFKNIQEGLKAVATGQTDVLLATLAQSSYHIASMGMNNVRIVGSTPYKTELALGVHRENKILASIFNKVLHSISTSEKQAIINRWSKDKFVSRVDYVLVFTIVLGAIFLIFIIILWYQKLLREINARQEAQAHYKALLDLLPTQVMIISSEGIIESANSQVLMDYQTKESSMIGQPFSTLLKAPNEFNCFDEAIAHDGVERKTVEFVWQNRVHSMMLSILPITHNNAPAFLALAVDITERVTMEKIIIEAKNAAIDANHAKSSFLANMSHEIRTPMNAIIGFTELLFDEIRDPKMVSYIKTIRSAGNSLLLLINDILDLSKIESGKLHIQLKSTNLHQMVEEIGCVFEVDLKKKSLGFVLEIAADVPKVVMLDEPRLRQVLFNLIGNAVKFTHEGTITLKITATSDADHQVNLGFYVEDTGVGISEDAQTVIFESFVQPKGQDVVEYGGSGLGLAISKRLISLMHGELTVQSKVDIGSTFSFVLPSVGVITQASPLYHEGLDDNDLVHFNGLKVLVADDVDDNRQLLAQLLPTFGLEVVTVCDGQAAVNSIKERHYDLVMLDIRMPVMNGYEAAGLIRKINPLLPIIAITASVMSDEQEVTQRHQFDGYLCKPVLRKDIINELKRHLSFVKTSIKRDETDETVTQLHLDDETKQFIATTLVPKCRELLLNNNIDEITLFISTLVQVAKEHHADTLMLFCEQWMQAVDCFDVIEIQRFARHLIAQVGDL